MSEISFIASDEIVTKVMVAVKGAEKEILATHLLASDPPDEAYTLLLKDKTQAGVQCKRVIFSEQGVPPDEVLASYPGENKVQSNLSVYQRMLLIDDSVLFWGVKNAYLTIFFTTQNSVLIKKFRNYFQACWTATDV